MSTRWTAADEAQLERFRAYLRDAHEKWEAAVFASAIRVLLERKIGRLTREIRRARLAERARVVSTGDQGRKTACRRCS